MKVGVPAETRPGERRVAMVPDIIPRLTRIGLDALVETGAGRHAFASDEDYAAAGATVVPDVLGAADVLLTVGPLDVEQARALRPGTLLVGLLGPATSLELVRTLRERDVTSFAMELVPRCEKEDKTARPLRSGCRCRLIQKALLSEGFRPWARRLLARTQRRVLGPR